MSIIAAATRQGRTFASVLSVATHAEHWGALFRPRRAATVRRLAAETHANNLLTYASAISFRVLFSLIFLVLATFALAGSLHLGGAWQHELAPALRAKLGEDSFRLLDQTVSRVLSGQEYRWLTLGLVLTIWQVSGGVRCVMAAVNDIFEEKDRRSLKRKLLESTTLAAVITAALLGAGLMMLAGGRLGPVSALRWIAPPLVVTAVVFLVLDFGVARHPSLPLVSAGSVIVMLVWMASSAAFAVYATRVANYGTLFGDLAVLVILLTYLYLSSVVFLLGVQADALLVKESARKSRSAW